MTEASASARERAPSGKGGLSNLAQRILFALVAIPVVLGAVWLGDWALASVLAIASALAAWEFYRIAERLGTRPMARAGIAIAALLPLAIHARYLGLPVNAVVSTSVGAVLVVVLFSAAIFARGVTGRPLESVSLTVFGIAYTGAMLSFAYMLRYHQYAIGRTAGVVRRRGRGRGRHRHALEHRERHRRPWKRQHDRGQGRQRVPGAWGDRLVQWWQG